ncbi:ADP-ribose pyrophosphatase [Candidatus Bilamarchaeum dharawalense]|uniref:8-oxo-dGTP diphosphatase n=1 Tax=Candidatus Bilamarchaeum dharawalense TaxID=2885759 RepID=A0A5E4LQN7_9ARCH|nr:ADP-ribose pyrophosphatase [Candidatus Bilamarchaeum dharawalense]
MKINVAAGIIQKNNKILIAQRKQGCKREPNKWEFPGGKIEKNETPENALKREIKEELGMDIVVGDLFGESAKKYPNGDEIILSCYFAKLKNNKKPKLTGCQKIEWASLEQLTGYDFAEADQAIISLMKMKKEQED